MAKDDNADPQVRDNPDLGRYEVIVDGVVAGFVTYEIHGENFTLVHTKINDAFEGKGLGGVLARATLDDLRARGKKVIPVCPYVTGWIERHPDYTDLVAPSP